MNRNFQVKQYQLNRKIKGLEGLGRVSIVKPKPGYRQVLIKVAAVSLNFRDHNILNGNYPDMLPESFVPVSDGAGEVTSIGDGVTRFTEGDRVVTHFLPKWRDGVPDKTTLSLTMGAPLDGVLSEYAIVSEDALIAIPTYMSFLEAATLPIAALTAWQSLVIEGRITAASTVVVQGTGGVALFAIQFAKMHGARVIVTSSSNEKIARAKALGADEGINYRLYPEWSEEVLKLTHFQGADLVLDVAGMTINQSLAALKPGGIVCAVGLLDGFTPELNILPLLQYRKRIIGITVGSYAMFEQMLRAMERHKMHPYIDTIVSFDSAKEAFKHMQRGDVFGKIVIKIS